MAVPPKKLAALVDKHKKSPVNPKAGGNPDEDHDEEGEHEDQPEDDKELAEQVGAEVQEGKTDGKLMKLMAAFSAEENPPEWVADEAKWERAKEAVDPEGEGSDKYDDPWAVVAHVYKKMGGGMKGGGGEQHGGGEHEGGGGKPPKPQQ